MCFLYNEITGLYKISEKLLRKLIKKRITVSGRTYNGASRLEILSVLYFAQIADQTGRIKDFKTSDLAEITGCTVRQTYILMHSMQDKGILTYSGDRWTGIKDIILSDSDFSYLKDSAPKERYLNINHGWFIRTDGLYKSFRALSLYSMRLFLMLFFNYSTEFGFHMSYKSICETLGLRSKYVINSCLKELRPLLDFDGDFYTIKNDKKRRLQYGYISMPAGQHMFMPETGVRANQDSYYKRYWIGKIQDEGFMVTGLHYTINDYADQFYMIARKYIDKISRETLEHIIMRQIKNDGILNEMTVYRINAALSQL
jgi:hypothetical protein